jgi:dihydropyrimidinase
MDLGILNGKIYLNGEFIHGNLYCKNGKVDTITTSFLPCKKEFDAAGKMVLPGFIDPHVHFRLSVGANTSKDDFYLGSVKGALGGVTTYIDFLDPVKNIQELEAAFLRRRELASVSVTDYSFHTTIANPTEEADKLLKAGRDLGLPSLKLFTTYSNSDRRTYDGYIDRLLYYSKELESRIVIHAENDDLISTAKDILVKDHEASRPVISERSEVIKLVEMAKERDGLLYIVHISAGSTVETLVRDYSSELKKGTLLMESCPHYFLKSSDCYLEEDGYCYTMTPPLRNEVERNLLRKYIEDINVIGTDHCPFDLKLKKALYTSQIPMGVGGIEYSFSNMYTEFGSSIIPKYTEAPAKAYGLYPYKGTLLPGADADIVIYADEVSCQIADEESIYHGRKLKGKVEQVFLRGNLLVDQGKFLGELALDEIVSKGQLGNGKLLQGNGSYRKRELKLS